MRRLLPLFALCLAALALAAAGCGSDDDDGDSGGGGTTTETQTQEGGGGGGAALVDMKNIEYVPKEITVKVGQKIDWTNGDSVAHTVTSEDGAPEEFDSGTMEPGDKFSYTPKAAGEIPYFCVIHPNQKGKITVE
jgi:plastocyanin